MERLPEQWAEMDIRLRQQGLCIVPIEATPQMNSAAANAMRKRREALGDDWFLVGSKTKAGLRWTAMLETWRGQSNATPPRAQDRAAGE